MSTSVEFKTRNTVINNVMRKFPAEVLFSVKVGRLLGVAEGAADGEAVGGLDGFAVGALVTVGRAETEGAAVGSAVGAAVGEEV